MATNRRAISYDLVPPEDRGVLKYWWRYISLMPTRDYIAITASLPPPPNCTSSRLLVSHSPPWRELLQDDALSTLSPLLFHEGLVGQHINHTHFLLRYHAREESRRQ